MQHAQVEPGTDAARGLPLQPLVADVGQIQARCVLHRRGRLPVGAVGEERQAVVARLTECHTHLGRVDAAQGAHPAFAAQEPGSLYRRVEGPTDTGHLQSPGLCAVARGGGEFQSQVDEVLVQVTVVGRQEPGGIAVLAVAAVDPAQVTVGVGQGTHEVGTRVVSQAAVPFVIGVIEASARGQAQVVAVRVEHRPAEPSLGAQRALPGHQVRHRVQGRVVHLALFVQQGHVGHAVVGQEDVLGHLVPREAQDGTQPEAVGETVRRAQVQVEAILVQVGQVVADEGYRVAHAQFVGVVHAVGGLPLQVVLPGAVERRLDERLIHGVAHLVQSVEVHARHRLGIGDVGGQEQALREFDVAVEAHVQAAETGAVHVAVVLAIAQREAVERDVVATGHVDAVVLHEGRPVHFVQPVGLLMRVPVVRLPGVVLREVELLALVRLQAAHDVGGIAAVGCGLHHGQRLERRPEAHADVGLNLRGHVLGALRADEHHTGGALRAPDGRAVAQHLHAFDVVGVDQVQRTVAVARDARPGLFLHLPLHAVDDEQGLATEVDGLQASDEVGLATAGLPALPDDVQGAVDVRIEAGGRLVVHLVEDADVDLRAALYGHHLAFAARSRSNQGDVQRGQFNLKRSVVAGHGAHLQVGRGQADTGKAFARGGTRDTTADRVGLLCAGGRCHQHRHAE